MVPLVVIRPEPGCSATVDMARSLGLETVGQPLFVIEPRSWQAPVAAQFDALLIGSAIALPASAQWKWRDNAGRIQSSPLVAA